MGKLLDELAAMIAVVTVHLIEVALVVAGYAALIVGGWWMLEWLFG